MESEYIIVYDENGEPHLEHAWLRRGQAHKYIMKIGEGLKARYFYTQAEVDAYMKGAKKGYDAGRNSTKLGLKLNEATRKPVYENNSFVERNRARNLSTEDKGERVGYKVGKGVKKAVNKANETADKVDKAYRNAKYDAEETGNKIKENAKSAAKRLNENTKSKMDKMREEFRKPAEAETKVKKQAENKRNIDALNTLDKVKDKIEDTSENLKARRNVKKLDKEIKEERSKLNNMGNLDGQRKIRDLEIKKLEEQTKYDKSPETIAVLEKMKDDRKKQDKQ